MQKNPAQTEQTKKNLIEAYWICCSRKKHAYVTVKEVVETAGYNRSTFYAYFEDIVALAAKAEDELIDGLEHVLSDCMKASLTLDSLETGIERMLCDYGSQLEVVFLEHVDTDFLFKFQKILSPMAAVWFEVEDEAYVSLVCQLISSSVIAALGYIFQNPGTDRKEISHILHIYLHAGMDGMKHEEKSKNPLNNP